MKLGIMQPYFFPYIGYFSLLDYADEFILFDTAQYDRKSWMKRNRVLKPNDDGWQYIRAGVLNLVNFLIKPGIVGEIIGAEIVSQLPGVIKIVHEVQPGDVMPDSALGALRQIAFRVFAEASDRDSLATIMERIHSNLQFYQVLAKACFLSHLMLKKSALVK